MRLARLGAWVLFAMQLVAAVMTYQGLPAEIPMHVALDGTAGNFVPRSPWTWALLPAVALAMQLLFGGLVMLIRRKPQHFNFPAKDRFLALPPERQAPVIEAMIRVLDACAFGTQAVFLLVLGLLWDAAQGTRPAMGVVSLLVLSVLLAPVLLVLIARLTAIVEREEKRARAGASERAAR